MTEWASVACTKQHHGRWAKNGKGSKKGKETKHGNQAAYLKDEPQIKELCLLKTAPLWRCVMSQYIFFQNWSCLAWKLAAVIQLHGHFLRYEGCRRGLSGFCNEHKVPRWAPRRAWPDLMMTRGSCWATWPCGLHANFIWASGLLIGDARSSYWAINWSGTEQPICPPHGLMVLFSPY